MWRTALFLLFLFCLLPSALNASPAQRVVALAPSLTELTFALGAGSRVVGRTMYSETPKEAQALPTVGPYFRPNVERIMALRPDLCLAIHDGTPQDTIRRLRQLGVPVLELTPDTFEGLMATLYSLGHALGVEEEADRAIGMIRTRLSAMDRQVRVIPENNRPVVLFQVQALPPMFAGANTFCGELIRRAGGHNPLSSALPYPLLNVEDVLALRPDVILIPDMARVDEAQALWRRFPAIPAVQHGRIHVVSADLFNQPTLRSLDALETLHALLYPPANGTTQLAAPAPPCPPLLNLDARKN